MIMTAKRLLSLALVIIMMLSTLSSLVACDPADGGEVTTPAGTTVEDGPADADRTITLFENGQWTFQVVRHSKLTTVEESASINFRTTIGKVVDGNPKLTFARDNLKEGETYDKDSLEIYYGNTLHPEMKEFIPTVGLGEAAVKVVGNKILIYSNSYDGYDRVSAMFARVFAENYKDGKIVVKVSDIEDTLVINSTLNEIPSPDGVALTYSENCEYNQSILIFEDATPDVYKNYVKKFTEFTEIQSVESAGNYFKTYKKGADLFNVSYSKGDDNLRVIVNRNTAPTKYFEKPASVEQKATPMILMHGLADSGDEDYQNGLCMLIRLSDGRFIVIDGGFNRQSDADKLYSLLKKHTPSGMKPTVAAWIITHAHGDHHATFASKFVYSYKTVVDIQSLIFNPPSAGINRNPDSEGSGYKNVVSVAQGIQGCEWIRAHVGDKYYVGDAVIDVIYSVDQMYPTTFTYYNTCSLILSIEIAGQRFMMTGDAANVSFQKAVKMFGDTLKCDIVQVAHHGYGTGVSDEAATSIIQAYKYMSPSLVLWPIGNGGYNSVKNRVYNQTLANLPSVKKIIVARNADHIVDLPFKGE